MELKQVQTVEDRIDLLELLHMLAKRWKFIAKATAIAAVVSIIYALIATKIYTATARVLPPQQDDGLMSAMIGQVGGLASIASGIMGGTPADMYVGILKSEAVKDKIIDRYNLIEVYEEDYRVDTYKKIDDNIDIRAGKKDGIISISVEDKDPKLAASIANAYVDELGKLVARLNVTGGSHNRSFLEQRLNSAKAALSKAEENLAGFQKRNGAVDVPAQAKASIEGIAILKAQLAAQEVQLATLRGRFTDSAQEVMDLKFSIARTKREIAAMEGSGSQGVIPAIGNVPALSKEYIQLIRELKSQEALVEVLTKQYEIARLTEAKDLSNLQIIQEARVPDKKTRPKRALIVIGITFLVAFMSSMWVLMENHFLRMSDQDRLRLREIRETFRLKRK